MIAALAFLTRIPLRPSRTAGRLDRAALFFPLVGLLVGGTGALVRIGVHQALPRGPATVVAIAAMIALTGGLHEDGLADTADAAAPHASRERRLEIMRDPRIGSFGVLALALALLLAVTLLAPLSDARFARVVLVGHVLARWSMLPLAAALSGLFALWATRTLGGVTGDVYGAANKLVELAAYAALA
jgi:adenosylcobinamide-GDP ribazoletransferase